MFVSVAVICDLKDFRIPNELILLGYVTGLFISVSTYNQAGILMFLVNVLWPIAALYIFFLLGGLGAGDLKLFSVIATMVGANYALKTMVISLILGALLGMISIVRNKKILLKMVAENWILGKEQSFDFGSKYIPCRIHFSLCIATSMLLMFCGGVV